ncbi:MAG TPA: class I SAM-dependent methyltransferase [Kofleriaceae bacterium]|nr:class I SAM-dependent methyltransferase [Kofleriaceae bacterium]
MSRAETTCRICGGELAVAVAQPRSSYARAGDYRIDACASCGAGTTIPWPSDAELARCYESTYGYGAHDLIEDEKRRRSAWLLAWSGVRSGRVLDVGCMFGFLLDEAARAGLATHGIELSPGPAAAAAERGHDVFVGTIEAFAAAHRELRFDAIFAQHVLEHIADPRAFLATARALLQPHGKLVVCVPNFEARLRRLAPSAWGWYQVPVHLHHYSSRALARLLGDAGFAVGEHRTRGGDSLFLVLSALQSIGMSPGGAAGNAQPGLARTALRWFGAMTRPYHALGDDELAVIASPAHS